MWKGGFLRRAFPSMRIERRSRTTKSEWGERKIRKEYEEIKETRITTNLREERKKFRQSIISRVTLIFILTREISHYLSSSAFQCLESPRVSLFTSPKCRNGKRGNKEAKNAFILTISSACHHLLTLWHNRSQNDESKGRKKKKHIEEPLKSIKKNAKATKWARLMKNNYDENSQPTRGEWSKCDDDDKDMRHETTKWRSYEERLTSRKLWKDR